MFKIGDLNEVEQAMKSGVWDFTVDGKCSNCGQCCSNLLPMTIAEINRIRKYIRLHGIKEQKHLYPTVKPLLDAVCPFRNNDKKRCEIYEVRPAICREFQCDKPKKGIAADMSKFQGKIQLVLVRDTFFGERR